MWTYDAQSAAGIAHSNPATNVKPNRAKRSRLSVHPSHPQILGRSGKHNGSGSSHSGGRKARPLSHRLASVWPFRPQNWRGVRVTHWCGRHWETASWNREIQEVPLEQRVLWVPRLKIPLWTNTLEHPLMSAFVSQGIISIQSGSHDSAVVVDICLRQALFWLDAMESKHFGTWRRNDAGSRRLPFRSKQDSDKTLEVCCIDENMRHV